MQARGHKHLVLILARQFASNLATPTLVVDAAGTLVFFNEAAERFFDKAFAEVGEMPLEEWTSRFEPRTFAGKPLRLEDRPAGVALYQRRPAHERFLITSVDGRERSVSSTAIPLFAHADEFVGVIALYWRDE